MENHLAICQTLVMAKELTPAVKALKAWRAANNLSQSQAVAALNRLGLPVTLDTLQNWETGRRKPMRYPEAHLTQLLARHPKVTANK